MVGWTSTGQLPPAACHNERLLLPSRSGVCVCVWREDIQRQNNQYKCLKSPNYRIAGKFGDFVKTAHLNFSKLAVNARMRW